MEARSFRMFVDGAWCDAASGATYDLPNPATEETAGTAPDASRDDMERAIVKRWQCGYRLRRAVLE